MAHVSAAHSVQVVHTGGEQGGGCFKRGLIELTVLLRVRQSGHRVSQWNRGEKADIEADQRGRIEEKEEGGGGLK